MAKTEGILSDRIEDNAEKAGQGNRRRPMRFIEDGVKTQYASAFNVSFGQDEVVFIFGNPSINPNVVRIESKIAVSIKNAKRIAITLGNLVRQYEAQNGMINIITTPGDTADQMNVQ